MKPEQELLIKQTAYKIMQALSVFQGLPPNVRNASHHAVMTRVRGMLEGIEGLTVEGPGLVTVVPEPEEPGLINREDQKGEDPEAV
jgi:hypothetical protein